MRRSILAISLVAILVTSHLAAGGEIRNSFTAYPPWNVVGDNHGTYYVPGGTPYNVFGHGGAHTEGTIAQYLSCGIIAAYPYAGGTLGAYSNSWLGHEPYQCVHTGNYMVDADVHIRGMAGVYMNRVPDVWGDQSALTWAGLRITVNQVLPIWPWLLLVKQHDYVLGVLRHDTDYTGSVPHIGEINHRQRWLLDVSLVAGRSYRVDVTLLSDVYLWCRGDGRAYGCVMFEPFDTFEFGGRTWENTNWGADVYSIEVRSEPLDEAAPVTTVDLPDDEPICGGVFVHLVAVDSDGHGGGGYGVENTYWRCGDEVWWPYDGPAVVIDRDCDFSFYSVDGAGNTEPIQTMHYRAWPEPAPALVGVPDGATNVADPITLEWEFVDFADLYNLQVDDASDYSSPDVDLETASTSHTLGKMALRTTYFWRVRFYNEHCSSWSDWSPDWSFGTPKWRMEDFTCFEDNSKHPDTDIYESRQASSVFELLPISPNPFGPSTEIRYTIPVGGGSQKVRLDIYDPAGRLVRRLVDDSKGQGTHMVIWDGSDHRGVRQVSGVYFCRLQCNGVSKTRRLIMLR